MNILLLGSGPNVTSCRAWDKAPFDHIIAINNAWTVRPDWDELVHPEDFPVERRPIDLAAHQTITTASDYIPAQNAFGGVVYAGGTMAFTAAYWALYRHRPKTIAFLGCDMIYERAGDTHFYGTGAADPLRADITLQSLEAKSARLLIMAERQGCKLVNLSRDESRLVFPRASRDMLEVTPPPVDDAVVSLARRREEQLGYVVASGRYWEEAYRFDPRQLRAIDNLWLEALDVAA